MHTIAPENVREHCRNGNKQFAYTRDLQGQPSDGKPWLLSLTECVQEYVQKKDIQFLCKGVII